MCHFEPVFMSEIQKEKKIKYAFYSLFLEEA